MKTFTYNIFINTTAPKLWEALTSPDFTLKYWHGFAIRSKRQVGSPVSLVKQDGTLNWKGKILTCEPYTSLSYTFDPSVDSNYAGENVSKVTWKLEPSMGSMMLTIIHEELSDKFEEDVRFGWPYFISSLKSLLETGNSLPARE
jgi:uncharacterized protein YndB with AHSA1/START domain